jgi:Protein of unknown function (DUF3309)
MSAEGGMAESHELQYQFILHVRTVLSEGITAMLGTILLVILILFLVGALPTWPHSRSWGYFPSGGIGLIVVILIILLLLGRI